MELTNQFLTELPEGIAGVISKGNADGIFKFPKQLPIDFPKIFLNGIPYGFTEGIPKLIQKIKHTEGIVESLLKLIEFSKEITKGNPKHTLVNNFKRNYQSV